MLGAHVALAAEPADAELRACGHGQEREVSGAVARGPALNLNSIAPADSSYVTSRSTVIAELAYDIDRFEPGMYQVLAQFQDVDTHATTSGRYSQNPELQFAHGVIRICYPLHSIWDSASAQWPLELVFNLVRRNDDGSSAVVAQSQRTRFSSNETPLQAVLRAPPTADQIAMREAVETIYMFFETVPDYVALCLEDHPSMKSSLQPPLEAWQKRYAALHAKSDGLYLDLVRQRFPGITPEGVLITIEGTRTAIRQTLRQAPDMVTESTCASMPGRFADGTYDPARQHPQAYALVNQ